MVEEPHAAVYQVCLDAIAAAVRKERVRLGLSQEELAYRAGLAPRHLQKIEAANVNVTIKTLAQIATAMGLRVHSLLMDV